MVARSEIQLEFKMPLISGHISKVIFAGKKKKLLIAGFEPRYFGFLGPMYYHLSH